MHHRTQLLVEMGSRELFSPELALNGGPPSLGHPSSWDYRCEPLVASCGSRFDQWVGYSEVNH
jgi:hypothetical protein